MSTLPSNHRDDSDVICLSSDSDEEGDGKTAGTVNGNGGWKKGATLLDMGVKVRPPSNGQISKPKIEPNLDDQEVYEVDDDSEHEIEYCESDTKGENRRGTKRAAVVDSDDEIQVLEDSGTTMRYNNTTRKKMSQEILVGKAAVNVGLPGINMSLIPAGRSNSTHKELSLTPVTRAKDIPVVEELSSSSLDEVVIEEGDNVAKQQPVLVEEAEIEMAGDDIVEASIDDKTEDKLRKGGVDNKSENGVSSKQDYAEESRRVLNRFLNEFCARKHHGIKREKLDKVKRKMLDAYNTIKHFHAPIHIRLKEEIEQGMEIIRCTTDLHWKTLKTLLDLMDPKRIGRLDDKTEDERRIEREQKKMELRVKYEKELAKMQKKIRKLEEAEVDFSDEDDHNSAYILADKYKAKLIQYYYTLCDLSSCNHFTGRPIQTRINLKKHNGGSNYDAIDAAVEKFINKKGFMFAPDYTDILDTIGKVNDNEGLGMSSEEILRTAQRLFENVIKIIKKRREKDFKMTMLSLLPKSRKRSASPGCSRESPSRSEVAGDDDNEVMEERLQDPAETDPELQAKLEANEALKKSEADVLNSFFERQRETGSVPQEIREEDDANASPPPTDNEEEDDDDDEEEEEDENRAKINNSHQHDELTEDEDEEAETVSTGWRCDLLPDENDEEDKNSNEGKITTAESESDTNIDTKEDNAGPPNKIISHNHDPLVKSPSFSDCDQPPPAKKMRADENCNEDKSLHVIISDEVGKETEAHPTITSNFSVPDSATESAAAPVESSLTTE